MVLGGGEVNIALVLCARIRLCTAPSRRILAREPIEPATREHNTSTRTLTLAHLGVTSRILHLSSIACYSHTTLSVIQHSKCQNEV